MSIFLAIVYKVFKILSYFRLFFFGVHFCSYMSRKIRTESRKPRSVNQNEQYEPPKFSVHCTALMTSSAFINPLRRFVAIRGKVTEFNSDKGTNFVGSTGALNINAFNIEIIKDLISAYSTIFRF